VIADCEKSGLASVGCVMATTTARARANSGARVRRVRRVLGCGAVHGCDGCWGAVHGCGRCWGAVHGCGRCNRCPTRDLVAPSNVATHLPRNSDPRGGTPMHLCTWAPHRSSAPVAPVAPARSRPVNRTPESSEAPKIKTYQVVSRHCSTGTGLAIMRSRRARCPRIEPGHRGPRQTPWN